MSESDLRRKIVSILKPLDAVSVENPAYPGTPDVNFIEGWVELKWLRSWPKREKTIVTIEHFTQQQRVWLLRRWKKGGNVYLLLQVRREWLLFTGETAAKIIGKKDRLGLIEAAKNYWSGQLPENEFISSIRSRNERHLI